MAVRAGAGMALAQASTSGILMAWRGTSGCTRSTCWAQGCQASPPVHLCLLDVRVCCARTGCWLFLSTLHFTSHFRRKASSCMQLRIAVASRALQAVPVCVAERLSKRTRGMCVPLMPSALSRA